MLQKQLNGLIGQEVFVKTTNGLNIAFNKKLKLVRVDELKNLIAESISTYNRVYAPRELTKADMDKDLADGVVIASFKGEGRIYMLPANRFEITIDGVVAYTHKSLGINLGLLKESTNLDGLKNDIKALIDGTLGIDSQITDVTLGSPQMIDVIAHDVREEELKLKITQVEDKDTTIATLMAEKANLLLTIERLQEYITNH